MSFRSLAHPKTQSFNITYLSADEFLAPQGIHLPVFMRATLIINPIAGTHRHRDLPSIVAKRLETWGYALDIRETQGRGDATEFAARAVADGYDIVIAAGGDGTVNETAAALCDTDTALAILPCGSGNGLARHLEIPADPVEALNILENPRIVSTDYGTVNDGRKFFCTFGMGFDAAVSHTFANQKRRGRMSYVKSAIEEIIRFKPDAYIIEADGNVISKKAFVVAVCNASQYGNNAYIAPSASIEDGLLDITIIHAADPLRTALVGVDMMTGYLNHNTLIQSLKSQHIKITRPSAGLAHIDGEPVTLGSEIYIKCHHAGMKVVVPHVEHEFKPFLTPARSFINEMRITINRLFQR